MFCDDRLKDFMTKGGVIGDEFKSITLMYNICYYACGINIFGCAVPLH